MIDQAAKAAYEKFSSMLFQAKHASVKPPKDGPTVEQKAPCYWEMLPESSKDIWRETIKAAFLAEGYEYQVPKVK